MNTREIASHILRCCTLHSQFEFYMFGSTLHGVGEDIDILVVGPSGDALSQIKQELQHASECLPLHILYMQPSEVKYTEFVTRENCVPLKQLLRQD